MHRRDTVVAITGAGTGIGFARRPGIAMARHTVRGNSSPMAATAHDAPAQRRSSLNARLAASLPVRNPMGTPPGLYAHCPACRTPGMGVRTDCATRCI